MPLPGAFRFETFPELLETPRLRLRRPVSGDESLCARTFFDAYETSVEPAPLEIALEFGTFMVEHWTRYGFGFFILEIARGPGAWESAGHAGLKYVDCGPGTWGETSGSIELGYALVPAAQGHGFATEAGRAVLEAALALPGVPSILGRCRFDNVRSAATLARCGMTEIESSARFRQFELRASETRSRVR